MSLHRICGVDELAAGEMRRVEPRGGPALAVFRLDDGFYVTDDTCTHAQASLTEGDLEGDEVVCPVHQGAFSVRTGEPLCFPVKQALRTYEVVIEAGEVWAEVAPSQAGDVLTSGPEAP